MYEKTIIESGSVVNRQNESKNEGTAWKHVTLGGVSGILMGAGLLYAGQVMAATEPETNEGEVDDIAPAEENVSEASLPVAQLHNDLSFQRGFCCSPC